MINIQESVPQVYYEQSRDFQLLGRLFELVLNAIKTSVDSLYYLPLADATAQTRFLDLLSYTLGFQAKHSYNNKQLAAVCSVFPTLLRKKGTIEAIQLLGDTILSSEGITEHFGCNVADTTVELFVPSALSSTNLLNDLLDYLLPAGMTCIITRADTSQVNAITEIKTKPAGVHFYLADETGNQADYKYPLPKTSVIPSINQQTATDYLGKTTRYATGLLQDGTYTWDKLTPVSGALANSAVLDTTGSFNLQTGQFYGNFYDVYWDLPLKNVDTGAEYTISMDGLETFARELGLSRISSKKTIFIDSNRNESAACDYSVVRDAQGIELIEELINEKNCICERFKAGKALSGSSITFPTAKTVKNIYTNIDDDTKIVGFEVLIQTDTPTSTGSGTTFTLAGDKTFGLLNLLNRLITEANISSPYRLPSLAADAQSYTIQFIIKDGQLITESLITEHIHPDIQNNKFLASDLVSKTNELDIALIEYVGVHREEDLITEYATPTQILDLLYKNGEKQTFFIKNIQEMRAKNNEAYIQGKDAWAKPMNKEDTDPTILKESVESSWEPLSTSATGESYAVYKHSIKEVVAQTYKLPLLYTAPMMPEGLANASIEILNTTTIGSNARTAIDTVLFSSGPTYIPNAGAKIIIKPIIYSE